MDADAILSRMRDDPDSDWPHRLLLSIADHDAPHTLTIHEGRVLSAYGQGLTRRMVADLLGISPQTVKGHARNARLKLRAKNTTHAVAEAIRRGLIR